MYEPRLVNCPHCEQLCEIIKVNCRIFRCGQYKHNGKQIPPHLAKEKCEELKEKDEIYGCGKPFRLLKDEGSLQAIVCDYI
jgi:hypothetical protein